MILKFNGCLNFNYSQTWKSSYCSLSLYQAVGHHMAMDYGSITFTPGFGCSSIHFWAEMTRRVGISSFLVGYPLWSTTNRLNNHWLLPVGDAYNPATPFSLAVRCGWNECGYGSPPRLWTIATLQRGHHTCMARTIASCAHGSCVSQAVSGISGWPM